MATPNPAEMGRPLFNSAVLLKDGAVGEAFHKTLLPTYDVFDEDRYFGAWATGAAQDSRMERPPLWALASAKMFGTIAIFGSGGATTKTLSKL